MSNLEARAYGPDCTDAERAAIAARVGWYEDGVILLRELPVMSAYSIGVMFDEVVRAVAGARFSAIVDLTESGRPSAEARARLRERLSAQKGNLRHVALFTGGNFLVRIASKFVFSGTGIASISVHDTLPEAVAAIRAGGAR